MEGVFHGLQAAVARRLEANFFAGRTEKYVAILRAGIPPNSRRNRLPKMTHASMSIKTAEASTGASREHTTDAARLPMAAGHGSVGHSLVG